MPELFKNFFNETIITGMGAHFLKAWPEFDERAFLTHATKGLADLELKARSEQITEAMKHHLPNDFEHAGQIMLDSLTPDDGSDLSNSTVDARGISGWAVMPMTHYVGLMGLSHFSLSMKLFKEMTKRFSSEFGIRFFLIAKQEETLREMMLWTQDENEHVRRLASEGARPRLPWSMQLTAFISDPSPLFPILEAMKDDPSEYVRRSVANHLNDITKDHPDVVAEFASRWWKEASLNRQKLVRHACRTLIKQGHQATLKALGYGAPQVHFETISIDSDKVSFGTALFFEVSFRSACDQNQNLILDYVIHHQKANGQTTPKVFKWKNIVLAARKNHSARKKHAFKPITTRVYYPGMHWLEILLNGVSQTGLRFELLMDEKR